MNQIQTQPSGKRLKSHALDHNRTERPRHLRPQLLVSIRSAEEAVIAVEGGAQILDVKEPTLGSLGMASCETIKQISLLPAVTSASLSLSVALGEAMDWQQTVTVPRLPHGIKYAKLGLAGCQPESDWKSHWQLVRQEFESRSDSRLNWVAVAYADSVAAKSPSIDDVFEAAVESNCAGLLIDTWGKAGKTLLDWISTSELIDLANRCQAAQLFLALAGQLTLESLARLSNVNADLFAIRSAACERGERTMRLAAVRIQLFRDQMEQVFTQETP